MEMLDEGCLARILTLTTPRDVCRLLIVSYAFRSAAESDVVWEDFLPSDYREIIGRAVESVALGHIARRKQLYLRLCDPILIDGGKKTFSLERSSGKICYMISARELDICWGQDKRYWKWVEQPDSRFGVVAKLQHVLWFDITGKINCKVLSKKTMYGAYLIYDLTENSHGLQSLDASICVGSRVADREVSLVSKENPRRDDGWLEVEIGEFLNDEGEDGDVSMRLKNHKNLKGGLILQGIEVRPKYDSTCF